MIRHIRDIQARRRGEELAEKGFTLIELLIVIVVLGILAATVVFALTGVTGQSAQAACNSDAKTVETAVQAYIDSPTNATNTPPASVDVLVSGGYIHSKPNNQAYAITTAGGVVTVTPTGGTPGTYDSPTTTANPCSGVS
jgi:prepilin-type N-terminal cleavage/methylation domain-containing protein